jgi:hypothetical protein
MSASLLLFIAVMLAGVAFGLFAIAAGAYGLPRVAALLGVATWLLVAVAVAMLGTVVVF